jgi:putative peptidoglycan lipid II flippase
MTIDPTLQEDIPLSPLELAAAQAPAETARIARAASIISLGNVASRLLGLVRETMTSHYFGAGGVVDAFSVASIIPTMLYDLLIGGMVNSSLVPVFSDYAAHRREDLWRLVSALLGLTVMVMTIFIIIVEIFAPQIALLLLNERATDPEVVALAANLLRITVPAVLFLSLSGVLSGLLYALRRFSYPAFTAAVFNAGMVIMTFLLHEQLGITAMAVGLLIGAIAQVLLQLPGLRDAKLRLTLTSNSAGLRRVALLYTPIALGLVVDMIGRPILYNLASSTGTGALSWMRYATYLIQLPQGLVATAVSFAILPTLTTYASVEARGDDSQREAFRSTLAQGLKLVAVLIIPATVGLFLLARPVVALIFGHGSFTASDTDITARALQFYLLGLPFAALDLLLVFSFYARQNTLIPSLIGAGSVIASLIVAFALLPTLGLYSIMLAESFKLLLHMAISAYILRANGCGSLHPARYRARSPCGRAARRGGCCSLYRPGDAAARRRDAASDRHGTPQAGAVKLFDLVGAGPTEFAVVPAPPLLHCRAAIAPCKPTHYPTDRCQVRSVPSHTRRTASAPAESRLLPCTCRYYM